VLELFGEDLRDTHLLGSSSTNREIGPEVDLTRKGLSSAQLTRARRLRALMSLALHIFVKLLHKGVESGGIQIVGLNPVPGQRIRKLVGVR